MSEAYWGPVIRAGAHSPFGRTPRGRISSVFHARPQSPLESWIRHGQDRISTESGNRMTGHGAIHLWI